MKHLKKILAAAMALFVAFAMVGTAFGETVITIDPQKPDDTTSTPTYTYYVMMKASYVADNNVSYYVEDQAQADALDALKVGDDDLFTVKKAAGSNRWYVTINKKANGNAFTGEEVAAALKTNTGNAIATGTASNNSITLPYDAYLLVESSLGTDLVLDTTVTKTIEEKNDYPSIPGGKQQRTTENGENQTSATASIGQTLYYAIPVSIPTTASGAITVVDTMTRGLTMNTAITVTDATDYASAEWALDSTDSATQAKTYKVVIPAETVAKNLGQTITLNYTAELNEDAVVKEAETNSAHLEYDHYTGVTSDTTVTTYGFKFQKTNGTDQITGAEFSLWDAAEGGNQIVVTLVDGVYRADVSPAANTTSAPIAVGNATVEGLAAGTYYLQEDKIPEGYNGLDSRYEVTVSANTEGENFDFSVVNQTGSTLPSTGGIGTTLFYVIGGILVAGAAIALVVKNRVAKEEK